MGRIFPVVAVEYRIKTHAIHGSSQLTSLANLFPDFPDPASAPRAEMAGLGDKQRPAITLPNPAQHAVQRNPALIARLVLPAQTPRRQVPLIGVIVISAEDVQIAVLATQFGMRLSRNHVPSLILRFGESGGLGSPLGLAPRREHLNDRLGIDEAGAPVDIPNRLAAGNHRANELLLEFVVAAAGERVENVPRGGPGEE